MSAGYDEQAVLAMLRDSAFRIRGLAAPEFAPVLLPISPLRELRWRGLTGASGYDRERAPSEKGPWTVVAENVPDAVVDSSDVIGYENQWAAFPPPAAPALWRDLTVKGAGPFFFRVTARNRAGRSPCSNVTESK